MSNKIKVESLIFKSELVPDLVKVGILPSVH